MNLVENKFGHGGHPSKLRSLGRRLIRRNARLGAFAPIDWTKAHRSIPCAIKNQFQSSSCGGQAGSYLLQVVNKSDPLSAKSIYSKGFADGGGMYITVLENLLANQGATLETEVPSLKQDGTTDELFMEDASWTNLSLLQSAAKRAGYTIVNVPIDADSMAQAIDNYGGIVILIQGKNNSDTNLTNWLSNNPKPYSLTNTNPVWGHYMFGYDYSMFNGQKSIDFLQSWGTSVGDGGVQHITEDYISSGEIIDCFALQKKQTFYRQLSYGDSGTDVLALQKYLVSNGFANFIPTGFFGTKTGQAVMQFQAAHGIFPTVPRVGPKTLALLQQLVP